MHIRDLVPVCVAVLSLAGAARGEESDASGPAARIADFVQVDDRFMAGSYVRVAGPVAGDLIAAGGGVDVDAAVNSDAIVAGGTLRVAGSVGGSVYACGGHVTVDGTVGRNARVCGGRVEIGPKADIAGGVSIAGGEVQLEGAVKRYVQIAGGHVRIDGTVGGDVVVTSGSIELGPNARIGGKLRYRSREELQRDPAAQVAGGIERAGKSAQAIAHAERRVHRAAGFVWTVGLIVAAAVLVAALPGFTTRVAATLRSRAAMSLLIGFIALVCIPVLAIVLFVTLVGIPLALLTLVAYAALLLLGHVVTGIGLGDWALARFRAGDAARTGWRIGAAVVALLAIAILARIPFLGGLVTFLVLIAGVGALLMQARRPAAAA
jgi:cytoskeletal protein CcmA (bactofilin family)